MSALGELKSNISPTIVTMVNNSKGYEGWEKVTGIGRILPAFPGAGGGIDKGVLDAGLTPRIIQPTTFGETDGIIRERTRQLKKIFSASGIPSQIVDNMKNWQISHIALVVPIADAYYMSDNPEYVYRDKQIMRKTAEKIKGNFKVLSERGMLSPYKFEVIKICPLPILTAGLGLVYKSSFGDKFMYRHAMKSPDEMKALHNELDVILGGN